MKILPFLFLLISSNALVAQEVPNNIDLPKQQEEQYAYDEDLLPAEFFVKNRQALRKAMPDNSVAIFFANPVRNRSNDVDFEYHQDPNFYYLTGLREPHAVLIIFKEEQSFGNQNL